VTNNVGIATDAKRNASIVRPPLGKLMFRWSGWMAYAVLVIAVTVFIGWALNIPVLINMINTSSLMNPIAAFCFASTSLSYLLLYRDLKSPAAIMTGYLLAVFPATAGLARVIDQSFNLHLGTDFLIYSDTLTGSHVKSYFALNGAIGFVLSGASLILIRSSRKRDHRISQFLALGVFMLAMFALLGYLYSVPEFITMFPYLTMSVYTIVGFFLLSLAILFYHPEAGLLKSITGNNSGSIIAQRLIPFTFAVPIVLGLLRLIGYWRGLFSTELGVAILVTSIIVVFLPVIWYIGVQLNRRDQLRATTERKFEMLMEAAPDAMIISDQNGNIVLVNKQTEKVFGYTREELIGQKVEILVPANFHGKHEMHRSMYSADPKIRSMGAGLELFAQRKDGTQFPVEISLSPLQMESETLISASVRDITDRKKAEDKFRSLLDAAPDATVIVNETGTIQMVNHQTENLFGYSRGELIGQMVELLIPSELKAKHVRHRGNFVQSANVRSMGAGIELNAVKKNGTRFPVEISLSPIQTEDGMLVSAAVRDISARKELEDELKKSNAELEAFTYSVSHDLRAPLRGIIGFTAILEEEYASKLDDEARRLTGIIKNNTVKMGHLVDDLLTFSRTGKQELSKAQIDVTTMVREILDDMLPAGNNGKNLKLTVDTLPEVSADRNTLRQVWINLISNAIKYSGTRVHPEIVIGSREETAQTIFFVKDNGVGFDDQYSHKLFKVFQRLHSSEEFEGTGVGLALVEKIVSRHGGKVWAEGKPGLGARFYFSLPK
jgi:PAS domain S-box-containing protein